MGQTRPHLSHASLSIWKLLVKRAHYSFALTLGLHTVEHTLRRKERALHSLSIQSENFAHTAHAVSKLVPQIWEIAFWYCHQEGGEKPVQCHTFCTLSFPDLGEEKECLALARALAPFPYRSGFSHSSLGDLGMMPHGSRSSGRAWGNV